MNISLDGGALCSNSVFGNYIFNSNLIRALGEYDEKNRYVAYGFCDKPSDFSSGVVRWKQLTPKTWWMKARVSVEEMIHPKDIFFALNQSLPLMTKARIFSFSHGLSFYYYPLFYKKSQPVLMSQASNMVRRSEHIFVSSIKVKKDFEDLFPNYRNVVVLPFGVPFDISASKKKARKPYFMFCGMDATVKNIDFLVSAMEILTREKKYKKYRLYLCGNFSKRIFNSDLVRNIQNPSRSQINTLYNEATAYVTSSWYESFNFPVVEALAAGCPVIGLKSAVIPEMQPYASVVDDTDHFVHLMKRAADGELSRVNTEKVRKEFSWQTYVKKLMSYYD